MKKSYILNMAMHELLRRRETEQKHIDAVDNSQIAKYRVAKYDAEIDELNEMILEAENENDDRLPPGYAEIEYSDFDNAEAIDGARFDDLNYQRYMER